MKSILALTYILLSALPAFGESLQDGQFYQVQGRTTTHSLCPADVTCVVGGSRVEVELPLRGCLDKVVSFSYKTRGGRSGGLLTISAVAYANPESEKVQCLIQAKEYRTINLPNIFGYITVDFLGDIK